MPNPHRERPGHGVMYWRPPEKRFSPNAPHFKGFIILKHNYRAGEKVKISAWVHETSQGTELLSLGEDDFIKARDEQWAAEAAARRGPREVIPAYARRAAPSIAPQGDDELELPE